MSNSEILLESSYHPDDSSVEILVSDPAEGDGYYGRSDGLHTVQYSYDNFIGTIRIQATIMLEPLEQDWFDVVVDEILDQSETKIHNFVGNYVWVRAYVEFEKGYLRAIRLKS